MTEVIRVKLKNYVFLQIDCDLGIKYEIKDHFTFDVPGAKFMPKFRAKVWDGKISLFDASNSTLYAGVYPELVEFAKAAGYNIELVESPEYGFPGEKTNILPEDFVEYCKSIEVQSNNDDLKIRSYQYEAAYRAIRDTRHVILSPTGSGKSLVIYLITRYLLDSIDARTLIVVPTTALVNQMTTDFIDYSTKNKFDVDGNVHQIMGGYEKNTKKKIVISTWQSLMRLPREWFNFDCVIIDECQSAKSAELQKLLEKCADTKYRFGTSGSLDKSTTHKMMIKGAIGPIIKVASTKQLIEKKQLSPVDIKCIVLNHPVEAKTLLRKNKEYDVELDYLVSCEKRNKFIVNLALSLDGNTLVMYRLVEKHGDVLNRLFLDKVGDRKYFYVHGKTQVDDREEVRSIMEQSNNAITLASYGVFGAGTNIKRIHNIIFASPSNSLVRVLQAIGRGLRVASGKDELVLFDIADDLSNNKKKNFTYRHLVERLNIYTNEEFPYTITTVNL